VVALLPYIFLTYQSHVPSRNQYVACLGVAWMLAAMTRRLPRASWRRLIAGGFVAFNVGYLWIAKAPQYEARAAPTDRLLQELRSREPCRIRIVNFPGNPWIAKETTQLVPGWRPDNLIVDAPSEVCPGCRTFTWDERARHYSVTDGGR
jgi:hypothetical protein